MEMKPIEDLLTKGAAEMRKWRFGEALGIFQGVLARDPHNAAAYQDAAVALLNLQRVDEAEEMSLKALEVDPELIAPHTTLAYIYDIKGDKERSRREAQLALERDPDATDALTCMGVLLVLENRPTEARDYLERASQIDPTNYLAQYNLAAAYQETSDKKLLHQSLVLLRLRPNVRNLLRLLYVSTRQHRAAYLLLLVLSGAVGAFTRPEIILIVTALLVALYVGTGVFVAFGTGRTQLHVLRTSALLGGALLTLGIVLYFFIRMTQALLELVKP